MSDAAASPGPDSLVLHHYEGSPFSEKIRLILGYKGLDWFSVRIPEIMPKPDLVALTGGYRKTPVLQVGADIYCDTRLMAELIERRCPAPTLFPAETTGTAGMLSQWADSTLFWAAIPYTLQPAGMAHALKGLPPEAIKAFAVDRASFTAGMLRPSLSDLAAQLKSYLNWLERQLASTGGFMAGSQPSVADFSVAQSVWFIQRVPPVASILDGYPNLQAWYQRVAAFGRGRPQKLDSGSAVALAAASSGSFAATTVEPEQGLAAGVQVTVTPTDYGRDPVQGELVGLTDSEAVIASEDERAGRVHVHFPRIGFALKPVA
jgi:glutathione S-transferase